MSKKSFLQPRHNVFTAEAEALAEHRAYNVAHSDASAMIDEISMQVGIIINKRVMKEAMQWRVNITGARYTTNALLLKHFIRNVSIQLVRLPLAYSGLLNISYDDSPWVNVNI
jgi:DNA-directed RNA polymerase